jgi:hypothetical protein
MIFANFRDRLIKEGRSDEEIEAFNKQYPMPETSSNKNSSGYKKEGHLRQCGLYTIH